MVSAMAVIAGVAHVLSQALPVPISAILLALMLGIALGPGLTARDAALSKAAARVSSLALRAGIVLLGARLSLSSLAEIGLQSLAIVIALMLLSLVLVTAFGTLMRLPRDLTVLLAVGTAVCGNSAIAAVAPIIRADSRHVGFAVATVTLVGITAVFAYPLIGAALSLPSATFGAWAGLSIHDTGQVVAAGGAYGGQALAVATIVKLVRNALMAPLIVAISFSSLKQSAESSVATRLRAAVPPFILLFLAMSALASIGVIEPQQASFFGELSLLLILVALAGIGLSIRMGEIAKGGLQPILIGFAVFLVVSVISLGLLMLFPMGT